MHNMYYNLDKIIEFVFGEGGNKRNCDVEITESFTFDRETNQYTNDVKSVREVKTSDVTGQTTRYELIRTMMDLLNEIPLNDDNEPEVVTLGHRIAINTLEGYGFVTEE